MRGLWIALSVGLALSPALACDDHVGACEVEDWRALSQFDTVIIEGVATCDSGMVTIRLYDGETFLGIATGFIQGHAFQALAGSLGTPEDLGIKYSISPEW